MSNEELKTWIRAKRDEAFHDGIFQGTVKEQKRIRDEVTRLQNEARLQDVSVSMIGYLNALGDVIRIIDGEGK